MVEMFVGTYTRKVQRGGWVRFPKDWLALLGDNREVFIMPAPGGGKSLLIVTAEEFRKELKRMAVEESPKGTRMTLVDSAILVKIAVDGRMQIPASLFVHAGIQDSACFTGHIRTVVVMPISLL